MKSLFTPLFKAMAKTLRAEATTTRPNDEWDSMLEYAKETHGTRDDSTKAVEGATLIVGAPVYLPSLFNATDSDLRQ